MTVRAPSLRGAWRDDEPARAVYSEAAGIQQIIPSAVAIPTDADDVQTLVRWAAIAHVPLTPRGSGSSMAGGAVGEGVVVDVGQLNAVSDPTSDGRVQVGPGAICARVDQRARVAGWRMPVDPSSAEFCTVGGMAATNASGPRALLHGPMRAWVDGLECVFADGTRAWIERGNPLPDVPTVARLRSVWDALLHEERRDPAVHAGVRKESSGYATDALASAPTEGDGVVDLLVGSEGTLAVFTAIRLRLLRAAPNTATVLAAFDNLEGAAEIATRVRSRGAVACELLDRTFLDIARQAGPIALPAATEAALLTLVEGASPTDVVHDASACADEFRRSHAILVSIATGEREAAPMWALRHAASPTLAALAPRVVSMQVIEDGAVPPERFARYVRGVRDLCSRHGFAVALFGHAGDAHLHANVLVDLGEPDWLQRLGALHSETAEFIASLGGTLSAEHGDGRLRAGLLPAAWSQTHLERFALLKRIFDPEGILNPGVKIPSRGASLLGGPVKYDPARPALPSAVRSALDRIQRERRWGDSRLALLAAEEGG